MRIFVPLHSFEPGGVERVALRLCAAWVASGTSPRVVLGRAEGAMQADAPALAYDVLQKGRVSTAAFETLWMIARLPGRMLKARPDLLFCAGNSYAVVGVAMKLLIGRRCPPIVLKVSNDLARRDMPAAGRPFYRLWLRIQGRLIDHFTGLAEPMRAEIASAMRVSADRITIIDDPALSRADIARLADERDRTPRSAPGRRFLAVGRLAPQKRFDLLLHAFAQIAGKEDRLAILGEGSGRVSLEALAASLKIADKVDLPGHVKATGPWLATGDCFVLSSDFEGVPAVLIEALASGIPIVATNCSVSIGPLLEHGALGAIVPVGVLEALAGAMRSIPRASPEDARAVADRFTIERGAGDYLALFAAVARRAAPRRCGSGPAAASSVGQA